MILSIVNNDDSVVSPQPVTLVEMATQLKHKPLEHASIILASVDSIVEASFTANGCNDIRPYELSLLYKLVMLVSQLPPI